jgi:tryptophan halogenase
LPAEDAFFKHAYHFDAGLYARLLRAHAEPQGVRRREGRITGINLDPETGFVNSVTMADGETIEGDFFIDCSGFVGLLIDKALGVGFRDWSGLLPCDRALAVPSESVEHLTPFTRSTAKTAGWQWRIPLQHRTGNGHVYCSQFMSDDEAAAILLESLDAPALAEPRLLKFTTGHRHRFWEKNVVAIGLAAGFMEPLESTSIQLIQTALARVIELMPDRHFDPVMIEEYNRVTQGEWERIRDFLILHYCPTRRPEPFWRHCASMPIPDTLAYKIAVFESCGRVALFAEESYQEPSWVSIFLGNGMLPRRYDPLVDRLPLDHLKGGMNQRAAQIARTAERMPPQRAFIESSCAARVA